MDATEDTVKKAYRRLALELHPDRPQNKGKEGEADNKFKRVQEAYEKLKNGRTTVDMLKTHFKSEDIHTSLEHFFFTTNSQGNLNNTFDFTSVSSSNVRSFTSSGSRINTGKKGQSLKTALLVTFKESLYGCTKTIEYLRALNCIDCRDQPPLVNCRECGGKGVFTASIGGANITTPCTSCQQNGNSSHRLLCSTCNGTKKLATKTTCTVEVPPGITTGVTRVFEGEGDETEEGSVPGDFIVCFEVEDHPFYRRVGDDVFCQLSIPFPHAILGAAIEIPSLYGESVKVTIPPGTCHHQVLKVAQEGFLNAETQARGDLQVTVEVELPKQLDEVEKNLLRQLASLPNFKPPYPSIVT